MRRWLNATHRDGICRERCGSNPSLGTWAGFGAMCLGMFMAVLDIQVVATSLPTIQVALKVRPDQMSWIQTSYLIAEVVAIPLTGVSQRALGMRLLSVISLAVYATTQRMVSNPPFTDRWGS